MSEQAKVTRTRRVAFIGAPADFAVEFTLPSGAKVKTASHVSWPGATITKALQYGITQLYQDGLARSKEDGPATDEDAQELIARFSSGDWSAERGSGGKPTLQSIARMLVTMKLKKDLGRTPKLEEVKAGVVKVLDDHANPVGYATVQKAHAKAVADWEALQEQAQDAEALGL